MAFARVLDLIREGGASKRAVMTMFRPEELAVPGNADVACPPSLVQMSLAATTGLDLARLGRLCPRGLWSSQRAGPRASTSA